MSYVYRATARERQEFTMNKKPIHTNDAPAAIGTYSQAIQAGNLVFLSGQIPLVPATMEVVEGDFEARARQVFENLQYRSFPFLQNICFAYSSILQDSDIS